MYLCVCVCVCVKDTQATVFNVLSPNICSIDTETGMVCNRETAFNVTF